MSKRFVVLIVVLLLANVLLFVYNRASDDINFSDTGNLVLGGEGRDADTWYLVYEEGPPEAAVQLVTNEFSRCKKGGTVEPCGAKHFTNGVRIKAKGHKEGDYLFVKEIQFGS